VLVISGYIAGEGGHHDLVRSEACTDVEGRLRG